MSKAFKRLLAMIALPCCLAILVPVSVGFADADLLGDEAETAVYGTPELGSNDPLWEKTIEHSIDQSTAPDDPRPNATGTARILWDEDYLYSRVVVEDSDVYTGNGSDHMYDSVEFYVGPGSSGSNQWRVSATGVLSGQNAQGRAAWTELTETGYIVEMRIPKRNLTLEEGPLTFEIYINNSSSKDNDRYEVVSSFGDPDVGFSSDASFSDSLTLIGADEEDKRFSITATSGSGGTLYPNVPGHVQRVEEGEDITFEFIPNSGQVIDTVMVDDVDVSVTEDNTYTIENVSANHRVHATFKNDPGAELLDFIVWNDNFAKGEYTTAVIIDLGEGNAVNSSELTPEMFTVSARDTTLDGTAETFTGMRNISRVYANDEPEVRGYLGMVANSLDYQDGLDSGRYIVVELEFYTETGGVTTLDGSSNSTLQVYDVTQTEEITLTEGSTLENVVFEQSRVVNPILDKFTTHADNSVNRALYLHSNANDEVVQELPLYVYIHGMGRGGTSAETDQKAAMKSANGAVALMQRMGENPEKYASHVLNISYNGISTPDIADVKVVIDDLVASGAVDSNRIYVAGFSWGGMYTNTLLNAYTGFFAAGAPMSPVGGSPDAANNEVHADLAYWMFVNSYDGGSYQTNLENFINENLPEMTNARASLFNSNESFVWPYNQFDQPDQNPPLPDYIAHEVEAAVLYNNVYEAGWDMAPTAGTLDSRYENVFDWMFAQNLEGEDEGESDPEPTEPEHEEPETTDPEPEDPKQTDPEPEEPETTDPEPEDPEQTDPEPEEPESTESDSSEELPATATNHFNMMLIGLAFLIVGLFSTIVIRKKTQKS
ncbi:LPXTG-motif cell wall anchor domain-containing protein [Pelagirhabdus alkalitolerans]|uniref:LPXTG-motif cell wall anchor domain-containing protein n=1 Tax=Pelagirhabdus alkalitolerans TaxID=1612202 RepID=A0A1G6GQZ0_9BACI|nr:sugar-binding protein [Pelagirhabdus alkalitolerans]SDB84462.1 LPXTG-motif cell wall anchor domain-containing protein [Pelagirhabdus alkalitolerans]